MLQKTLRRPERGPTGNTYSTVLNRSPRSPLRPNFEERTNFKLPTLLALQRESIRRIL